MHRDIKLENVMLSSNNKIKLIDFGFALSQSSAKGKSLFCGTPSYMSPELIKKQESDGTAADVWACGVILF